MDISIVIPIHNAADYIEECLDSVVRQTIKAKEIILVYDDKSENSLPIIRKYEDTYPYVHAFMQKGKGPASARNYGIAKASGKFVAFLDADDYYLDSNAIERMVSCASENDMDMCFGLRQVFDNFKKSTERSDVFRDLFVEGDEYRLVKFEDYQDDFHFHAYIYRREMLIANGVIFPENLPVWEDPPFLLKALIVSKYVCVCNVEFYCYRFRNHIPTYGERLESVLQGIYQNMIAAKENELFQLQSRLIERLNTIYYNIIRENFSRKTLDLLLQIEKARIISDDIKIFNELCNRNEAKESVFLNQLVFLLQHDIDIAGYLVKLGFIRIAVYGLGNYGEMLFQICRNSNVEIICALDNYKEGKWHDIEIDTPYAVESGNVDAIVVTMLDYKDPVFQLKKSRNEVVISFIELIENLYCLRKG